jgi:hypothetical protein
VAGYTYRSGAFGIFGFHNRYRNKKDDSKGSASEMFMGICPRKYRMLGYDWYSVGVATESEALPSVGRNILAA